MIQKFAQNELSAFVGLEGIENQYAMILADGGLIAGIAYLFFSIGVIRISWKLFQNADPNCHSIGLLLLSLFFFYFIVIFSVTALANLIDYVLMCVLGAGIGFYEAISSSLKFFNQNRAIMKEHCVFNSFGHVNK